MYALIVIRHVTGKCSESSESQTESEEHLSSSIFPNFDVFEPVPLEKNVSNVIYYSHARKYDFRWYILGADIPGVHQFHTHKNRSSSWWYKAISCQRLGQSRTKVFEPRQAMKLQLVLAHNGYTTICQLG
jgi:hypothetical protein